MRLRLPRLVAPQACPAVSGAAAEAAVIRMLSSLASAACYSVRRVAGVVEFSSWIRSRIWLNRAGGMNP